MTNDGGGTAVAADFMLSADGPTPISGAGGATSPATFRAGTYTLSETSLPGYTASAWSCVGATPNGNQITLSLAQNATCTITNDDRAASLTLVKVVINDNGGTAMPANFVLTASGRTGFNGAGPSVSSGAGFAAGTYTLSESGPAGYATNGWSCVGGTQNGTQVTVGLGQSATCTIINDDLIATPRGYTVQRAVLHDSLKIDSGIRPEGGLLTVTFRLYSDAECTTLVANPETVTFTEINDGGGAASTVNGLEVNVGPTYYWTAQFSGNNFNAGFTTACGSEKVDLAFTELPPAQQQQ